jgi:MFS family permease
VLEVLRQRNFALLWFAGLISIAGDYALLIALPLHVYRVTDSTLATAGAFAASYLPSILIGSLAGVFVDRWDRKRTMIWADLLRALLVLPLLFASSERMLWLVFSVAVMQGAIGLFFGPAENALLPQLVGKDRLITANALNALNNNLGRLVGPAVGAGLYAGFGLGGAAIADAVTFLTSAALIGLIAIPHRVVESPVVELGSSALRRALGEWRDGVQLVRRHRALLIVFTAVALGSIAQGMFLTLARAPLVLDVLGGSDAQVGWVSTAQAVGGLVAGVAVAHAGHRVTRRWLLGGGMVGIGVADLGVFNAARIASPGNGAIGVAMGCMFLAGFPAVALDTGGQSLLQELTEDEYRGRVFGALTAVQGVALLLGLGVAGVFGDVIGIVPVLCAGAGIWIAGGCVVLAFLKTTGKP